MKLNMLMLIIIDMIILNGLDHELEAVTFYKIRSLGWIFFRLVIKFLKIYKNLRDYTKHSNSKKDKPHKLPVLESIKGEETMVDGI